MASSESPSATACVSPARDGVVRVRPATYLAPLAPKALSRAAPTHRRPLMFKVAARTSHSGKATFEEKHDPETTRQEAHLLRMPPRRHSTTRTTATKSLQTTVGTLPTAPPAFTTRAALQPQTSDGHLPILVRPGLVERRPFELEPRRSAASITDNLARPPNLAKRERDDAHESPQREGRLYEASLAPTSRAGSARDAGGRGRENLPRRCERSPEHMASHGQTAPGGARKGSGCRRTPRAQRALLRVAESRDGGRGRTDERPDTPVLTRRR